MSRKLPGSAIVPGTITVTQITGGLNDTTNASYAQANTARTTANDAYGQANTARDQANTARTQANTAYGQANNAYSSANLAYGQANTAYDQANTARTQANTARDQANTARTQANTAYDQANTARTQANTAYGQANAAYGQANAAYGAANTRLSASGGTLSGDLIITGNLTVSGNSTTLNTEVLTVEDAEVILLSNVASTPALNAGIIVNRGTSTNTFLRWNETLDEWGWSDNGTTTYYFEDLRQGLGTINTTFGTTNTTFGTVNTTFATLNTSAGTQNTAITTANDQANSARGQANTGYGQANAAYGQANVAYGQANAAYGAANNRVLKAGDTMTGQLNVSSGGLLVTGNVGFGMPSPIFPLQVKTNTGTPPQALQLNTTDWTTTIGSAFQFGFGAATGNTYSEIRALSGGYNAWNNLVLQSGGGNVGIGTTNPNVRLDVRGIIQGQAYTLPDTGASAQWVKVGTLTAPQMGRTVHIRAYIHAGFNANNNQDFYLDIFFKTSNGNSVDGSGFAGNSWYYTNGFNATNPTPKWVANAAGVNAASYDLYLYLPTYTNTSHYIVEMVTSDVTWVNSGSTGQSDPGSASSTVCIASLGFNVPIGNVGIGTTTPAYKLDVNGTSIFRDTLNFGSGGFISWTSGYSDGTSQTFQSPTSGSLAFITNSALAMFIKSNQNVGIGTQTPLAKLDVVGDTYVRSGTFFTDTIRPYSGQQLTVLNGGSNSLYINGNVGIGTATPGSSTKLYVNGQSTLKRLQKQVYNWYTTSGSSYVHFKTTLKLTGTGYHVGMWSWRFYGYSYGTARIIDSYFGMHSDGSGNIYSAAYQDQGEFAFCTNMYKSSDNFLVIVGLLDNAYYFCLDVDIQHVADYSYMELGISAVSQSANTSGVY